MTHTHSLKNLNTIVLLLVGTLFLAACQRSNVDKERTSPTQTGYLIHRFEGIATCLPTRNQEYAWLLTKEYDSSLIGANVRKLAPEGVYLATQYGEILPANKPISGGAKISKIWRVPGFPFQLWAASENSIFLIDVPHINNAPLVDQVSVKPVFIGEVDEVISTFEPVANSRSAWLTTSRGAAKSNSLYLVDGDSATPPKSVQLPEEMSIHAITSSPRGNSAWVAWQKTLDSFETQSGAIFVENNSGVIVAREPIVWEGHAKGPLVPIANGALAWRINREPLREKYFAGLNPALVSSDGRMWSIVDALFPDANINYAVRENTGDDLPMWAWVENKPGIYLIEATNDGPRIRKKLIDDVLPKSLVPSPDGTSAWVLTQNGRSAYRIGTDGSARRFDLPIEPGVQASVVVPSPNGQKAWVAVAPGQSKVCSLFFLDLTSEQRLKKSALTPMSWQILPAPDNQHAFVVDSTPFYIKEQFKEFKHYVLRDDQIQNSGEPLLTFDGTKNSSLSVSDSPVWAHDGESRCWVVRWKKGAITSASISFNNAAELSYREGRSDEQRPSWSLAPGTKIENVKVKLILEGQRSPKDDGGSVRISFLDSRSKETIYKAPEVKLQDSDVVQLNWSPSLNHPYEIDLTFRDLHGTKSVTRWSNVEFRAPLLDRPLVRTLLVFLVLCGFSYLVVAIKPTEHGIRRWVPLAVMFSGGAANFQGSISGLGIDSQLFTRLFAVLGVVLLAVAWFSPALYRTLARMQPFHWITPYLLRWRSMRRRVFMPYAYDLRRRIKEAKESANNEIYTPIPATLQEPGNETRTIANPAEEIARSLTSVSGSKPAVLVEAPGGTGKSALLREVIEQSLTRFEEDPRVPLPIRCEGTGSLEDMAFTALGRHAISRATLAAQIEMGHFFLVIDGPQDRKVSADEIRNWVRSEKGQTAALLIASRPKDDIQANVRSAEDWRLMTPQRLTEETLDTFQETYVNVDTGGPTLTAEVKDLCRASDGSYLPILIRLALLVGSENVDSIAELYRRTFRFLLTNEASEESGLLTQAEGLCVETYWESGYRTIEYAEASDERLQLLKQLKNAGVLVAADPITSRGEPREVRFFHDSMQTYLTARGLFHGTTPWSQTLLKAAGHPRFRDSEHGDGSEFSSEMFRMCLQVYAPEARLQDTLETDLRQWAERYRKDLTRNDVERALPTNVVTELNNRVTAEAGAGAVLNNAVTLIKTSSNSSTVEQLGRLYARIAEKVWALEPRQS